MKKVRIVETWTRYRTWSAGNHTPYVEVWWDDAIDGVNDNGFPANVNSNTAQNLRTGSSEEPWIQDRELSSNPVVSSPTPPAPEPGQHD